MAYDWQSAYQIHLRTAHGRSHMNVDEAMIKVCPQTVFACGFEYCTRVFESFSEDDATNTLKEYSGHVVKHFDEGSDGGRWLYSTRVRNLLRQSQVSALWEKAWPEMERPVLRWATQTSLAARKLLEAGHLEKLPFLIRCLIILGSDGGDLSKLEGRLELPVKEKCPAPYSHRFSLNTKAQSPLGHDLERDMEQFQVSEGHVGLNYASGSGSVLGPVPGPGTYGRVQPTRQVPRSIEAVEAFDQQQTQTPTQHSNYSDAETGAASLQHQHLTSSHQLFYHDPTSSNMFTPSPAILPSALQPLQQHYKYIDVAHEGDEKSETSPAGFHSMPSVTADPGSGMDGMDVDMAGGRMENYNYNHNHNHNHTAPPPASAPVDVHPSQECWMGHYSHMAMPAAASLSSEGYDPSSQCTTTPEHNRLLEYFGPPGRLN
ncbi:hypothetical protein E4U21_007867 [Claviceps maximensis]|nr:hypothetical protein E4U21_007867 [Claviceps maximensis]